jgi:hypothetical protein
MTTSEPGPTHWHLSVEQILTTLVLLGGMIASYTALSSKVENLSLALGVVNVHVEGMEERVRLHELLPIHPVARTEVDNLVRRLGDLERLHDQGHGTRGTPMTGTRP